MRLVMVGAGGIARELVRRLGESWEITVVDVSRERLERIACVRPLTTIEGDGSSRVVLLRAGLERADALVTATRDDDVNLEVCRLARAAGIERLAAVVRDPDRAADYRALGVGPISAASLAARRIELGLETRRLSSTAFADGRAEAIEFRVAADSPVRGRPLRDLRARSWIVGAVLRGEDLVIPHGDTVLEAGDLVTIVGAGADFGEIVRTFTGGEARFPLEYGKRVAVAVDGDADVDGPLREAVYLVRNSRASSLVVVHRDPAVLRDDERAAEVRRLLDRASEVAAGVEVRTRAVPAGPHAALESLPAGESVAVLVLGAAGGRGPGSWWKVRHAAAVARRTHRPVLLARGRPPYRRVVTPARHTPAGRVAARVAIDLAHLSKASLHALAVVDPVFIAGPDADRGARDAIAWLEEDAAARGLDVESEIVRGNPVRAFSGFVRPDDLLVLAAARLGPRAIRVGGIAYALARRSPASVLLVPLDEGA